MGLRNGQLDNLAIILGFIAAISVTTIFFLVIRIESQRGSRSAEIKSSVGFDPDDAMLGTSDYFGGSTTSTSTKKGVSSAFNDTRRISDSVSLYLPPSVEDTTTAGYTDAATGIAGFLVASGIDVQGKDAAAIAKSISGAGKALLQDATYKSIGVVAELAGAEGADVVRRQCASAVRERAAFRRHAAPHHEPSLEARVLRHHSRRVHQGAADDWQRDALHF